LYLRLTKIEKKIYDDEKRRKTKKNHLN